MECMSSTLGDPLVQGGSDSRWFRQCGSTGGCSARSHLGKLAAAATLWFAGTTDSAFIRSEVNGRQSRRIILIAFFCTDIVGAVLWASWCGKAGEFEQSPTCNSLGINRYLLVALALPVEGSLLSYIGWNIWSLWSDTMLLPLWVMRCGFFDVVIWKMSTQAVLADALWFSVFAVMFRVHSLALIGLMATEVLFVNLSLWLHGTVEGGSLEFVRYGEYGAAMLAIVAGAYLLDEQSRLRSFRRLMFLEEQNSALSEGLMYFKVLENEAPPQLSRQVSPGPVRSQFAPRPSHPGGIQEPRVAAGSRGAIAPPARSGRAAQVPRHPAPSPSVSDETENRTTPSTPYATSSHDSGASSRRIVRFRLPSDSPKRSCLPTVLALVPTAKPHEREGLCATTSRSELFNLLDVME